MNIAQRTLQTLVGIITGDGNISPYRTGPKLVIFLMNMVQILGPINLPSLSLVIVLLIQMATWVVMEEA